MYVHTKRKETILLFKSDQMLNMEKRKKKTLNRDPVEGEPSSVDFDPLGALIGTFLFALLRTGN